MKEHQLMFITDGFGHFAVEDLSFSLSLTAVTPPTSDASSAGTATQTVAARHFRLIRADLRSASLPFPPPLAPAEAPEPPHPPSTMRSLMDSSWTKFGPAGRDSLDWSPGSSALPSTDRQAAVSSDLRSV